MQPAIITLPGYKINEYQLVLNPHPDLRNRIMQLKKEFAEKYPAPTARTFGISRPHLVLGRFKQLEMMEERIMQHVKTVAMGYRPFKVELKDFGSLPTHTIYIQVISKEPVRGLVKLLKTNQRLMKINDDNKPFFLDEPLFPVVQKLLPWQYEKAWPEYQRKNFTARFIADGMLLLKRRLGDKSWQIAQRFEFMNLPVITRQGELFG